MKRQRIKVANIHVTENRQRRRIDAGTVDSIAASIKEVGLRNPISVVFKNDFDIDGELVDNVPVLVAGAHRRAALLTLGEEFAWVECDVFEDEYAALLWEVSENLDRSDLTIDERAEHRKEWMRLKGPPRLQSGQLDQIESKRADGRGHRSEGGLSLAVREMPKLDGKSDEAKRSQLRRDLLIASRTEEAKEACRELGLADNQSALIEVAKALPEWLESNSGQDAELRAKAADAQVAKAREIKERQDRQAEINKAKRAERKKTGETTDLVSADKALNLMAADIIAAHKPTTLSSPLIDVIRAAKGQDALRESEIETEFQDIVTSFQKAGAEAQRRFMEWLQSERSAA
nr:MT-A70 family protein [Rhizobium sp. P007]